MKNHFKVYARNLRKSNVNWGLSHPEKVPVPPQRHLGINKRNKIRLKDASTVNIRVSLILRLVEFLFRHPPPKFTYGIRILHKNF